MIEQLNPLVFEFDAKAAEFSAFRRSDRGFCSSNCIAQDDNPRGAGSSSILVGYGVALLTETEVGAQAQCENDQAIQNFQVDSSNCQGVPFLKHLRAPASNGPPSILKRNLQHI